MPTSSSLRNAGSYVVTHSPHATGVSVKDWDKKRTRLKGMSGCSSEPSLGLKRQEKTPSVLVRGPMATRLLGEGEAQFDSWLQNRAEGIFNGLHKATGFISLDDLRKSFDELHMKDPILHMDDRTFELYCNNLFGKYSSSVDLQQYMMFHRAVWENQPLSVRRSHSGLRAFHDALHDAEALTRSAFEKYDRDASGCLDVEELPQVLEDLGFEFDASETKMDKFLKKQFKRADRNKDGKITYHEFVDLQNNFIETKEATEGLRSAFANDFKGGFRFKKF
eukprot:gnl/TRDRNA2_/TRDRNA2_129379_c0_seq1.p1 gnl/TRDRNA2_/TRDRNA2_129379_c0~~gnl/TRDRNA2_/TRDRNA2_129379_c0_seq1.p1  ORF type:complete len:278 (-),score=53.04 gnl/TRDRNA2_/TRDRNA2_129379_c0_seq1:6-839(-)